MKETCPYKHGTEKTCDKHSLGKRCLNKSCEKRHPKQCKYNLRGSCWRKETCCYLHGQNPRQKCYHKEDKSEDDDEIVNSIDVDSDNIVDEMNREMNSKCGKYESAEVRNKCDQCNTYFCYECEFN